MNPDPGSIELPAPPDFPVTLTVRVELDGSEPLVWRRLVLPGDLNLVELHDILQRAMGWMDTHQHQFAPGTNDSPWHGPSFVTELDREEGVTGTAEADARLDQVLHRVGDTLSYTYDFGDEWHHTLILEQVGPHNRSVPHVLCTAAEMACPLEDVGGVGAHNALVAAHRVDPALPDVDDYIRDWMPEGWEPDVVSLESINRLLQSGPRSF
ncbi:plasmid pRiA4b ORF-3 family protein [Ornithinicoccus hortensis]|uniref:PRiA4b ORF-3-like protein n=1 Tax=Ornithinicoccus hortensis TaxID=82346 RepID=A0A542YMK5_9MICO|nr:plasmid pRiA4b ORF-3 family protein [Ornithinicoccus hortensis]TQL49322.1 pRiA4b ORF-3-like protein [Ornithinicoccus hortensis]